ncbi:helix-turn-helix transcriptional regulator [Vibrio kasasachensis]|uniref:winged helix-turn-helix transcriptional regulator n=1 Tax=Vibrio kasasachensis TaxID=2910248 RepID=UPI003D0C51DA
MDDYRSRNIECPIRLALDRIADKWTVLIVVSLMQETKRFGELRKDIEGISQKMLTQTLRGMERDGLVNRKIYPVIPPKVEYSLTESGKSLIPILLDIRDWSQINAESIFLSRREYDKKLSES